MNDVLDVALRLIVVFAVFLVLPLVVGQTEHKVMAHMQGGSAPCTPAASTAGPSSSPTA